MSARDPLPTPAEAANADSPCPGQPATAWVFEPIHSLPDFLQRARALTGDTPEHPFHSPAWLQAWYETMGQASGRTALMLALRASAGGPDLALLPLMARQRFGLSVVTYADAGLVDYCAPILPSTALVSNPRPAPAQWRAALHRALRGHDVLQWRKLLPQLPGPNGGVESPLAAACDTLRSDSSAQVAQAGDDFDQWLATLGKKAVRDFARCWRNFLQQGGTHFERVGDASTATRHFEVLESEQSMRMRELGKDYRLDEPDSRAFHRRLLELGIPGGTVFLNSLMAGDQVVASQMGICGPGRFVILRQTVGEQRWRNCAPGLLITERGARAHHDQGRRTFDFGIGDYPYKQRFGVQAVALLDACEGLTARGRLYAALWRARRQWVIERRNSALNKAAKAAK